MPCHREDNCLFPVGLIGITKESRSVFKDSGIGIPEENIKKLFTPFFTTKQIGKGDRLGSGNSIWNIKKCTRGNIHVESEVGQYTCFTIELPIFAEAHLPKTEKQ